MAMTLAEIFLNPYLLGYIVLQFACWGFLTSLHRNTKYFCKCPNETARNFTNAGTYCWLGLYGGYTWFFDPDFVAAFEESKIYGFYAPARLICLVLIGSMLFDTVGMIVGKAAPEFFAHHILATIVSMMVLMSENYFGLYYAVYFFGYCELSSVPLVFVDLLKLNKDLMESYPALNNFMRLSFAFMFFAVRLCPWPFVLFGFMSELFSILDQVGMFLVVALVVVAIFFTGLQYFWGWLLIKNAMRMLQGQKVVVPGEDGKRRGSLTALTG